MSGLGDQGWLSLPLLQAAVFYLDVAAFPRAKLPGGHTQGGLKGWLRHRPPLGDAQKPVPWFHESPHREGLAWFSHPWGWGWQRLSLSILFSEWLEQHGSLEFQVLRHRWPVWEEYSRTTF